MSSDCSFAPKVVIDGETVTPKGYEWVLGFALAGCDWAIEKASEPGFLERVRADLTEEQDARLVALIKYYEGKIADLT